MAITKTMDLYSESTTRHWDSLSKEAIASLEWTEIESVYNAAFKSARNDVFDISRGKFCPGHHYWIEAEKQLNWVKTHCIITSSLFIIFGALNIGHSSIIRIFKTVLIMIILHRIHYIDD